MINPGLLMCFFAGLANGECGIFIISSMRSSHFFRFLSGKRESRETATQAL